MLTGEEDINLDKLFALRFQDGKFTSKAKLMKSNLL